MPTVAVIGSRSFSNKELLSKTLGTFKVTKIISGGAKGADSLAEEYAKKNDIPIEIILPNWSLGRRAGMLRNTTIIERCDFVIAFWDGESKGTADSIKKAKKMGKKVEVIS